MFCDDLQNYIRYFLFFGVYTLITGKKDGRIKDDYGR